MIPEHPLWRDRNAVAFVAVSLVAGFGAAMMSLAAGVWVMTLTGSSSLAALCGFCVFAPTLAGPVIGSLVDRFPRRPLLIVSSIVMAALLLGLSVVPSGQQVALIYLVMVAYGVNYVVIDAGESALLPAAVRPESLGRINGIRMSAQEAPKILAPLLGAAVFVAAGGRAVAAAAAGFLLLAALIYMAVRVDGTAAAPRGGRRRARDGVRFLWSQAPLRSVVQIAAVTLLVSALATAASYSFVRDGIHRAPAFLGVLTAFQGAGSIVGGLLAGRVLARRGEAALATLGAVIFAAGLATRVLPSVPIAAVGSLAIGVGLPWPIIAAMTAVQRLTPSHLLGRVSASATSLIFSTPAIGIPAGAAVLRVVDYRVPAVVGAITAAAVGLAPQWRERRRLAVAGQPDPGRSTP